MRLTLRTLIAWLDDKLVPGEVRTIGQQVAESPYAKELVERVHLVTRQRRLTVPGDTGPDGMDPNTVAGYIDNHLNPDEVTDYEKKCLKSDVHLAEVASVHQILSMIGQKAKVPPDAKNRMYRLIKGREATNAPKSRAAMAEPEAVEPATRPIVSWTEAVPSRPRWLENAAPVAIVVALIVILGATAIYSLRPDDSSRLVAGNNANPDKARVEPEQPRGPAAEPAKPAVEPAPPTPPPVPEAATRPDLPRVEEARREDVGTFAALQGVVLRFNPQANTWERVAPNPSFKDDARLLNLAPFRNTLKLGRAEVDLIDGTEVVLDNPDRDQAARLDLKRGRIVLHSTPGGAPIAIQFEGHLLAINPPTGANVGVEREPNPTPGQAEPSPGRLRIYVNEGESMLKVGEVSQPLSGPGEISLQLSGKFSEKGRQPIPAWVTESTVSPFSKEIGDQFTSYFRAGRPILSDLVEAMDDPQKDVKRLAVQALGALGDMESVVAGLERKDDPTVHRSVVDVLRAGLARGGDQAKLVHDSLVRQFDEPWAGVTERLLVGFRPEDARDEATLSKLVDYLATAPSRGTRELALDNLRSLTGRDRLEYDPDNPEGKGLKAWQDLVRRKELTKDLRATPAPAPR